MKLEVVEGVFEDFAVDAVVEVEAFDGLLPLEVEEEKFVIENFFPVFPRGHDSPNQGRVVPRTHVVLQVMLLLILPVGKSHLRYRLPPWLSRSLDIYHCTCRITDLF